MDYFIDIRVLPDPEFTENMLMAALFSKLHRALGQRGVGDIGVSFPQFEHKLGPLLRLHGCEKSLGELERIDWRRGLKDYCESSDIAPIPEIKGWRCVSRVQVKSSPERLLRRSVKKGWLTQEEAESRLNLMKKCHTHLPWLNLKSLSTGRFFQLFIQHGDLIHEPVTGIFSSYGLSNTATVPWF